MIDDASAQIQREDGGLHVAWTAASTIRGTADTQEVETEYPGMDWHSLNVLSLHVDTMEQTWIATVLIATDPGKQPTVDFSTPSPTALEIVVQREEESLEIRLDDIHPTGAVSHVPLRIGVRVGNDSPQG